MGIIFYSQLVANESDKMLQKGMKFGIHKTHSVVLISTKKMHHTTMKILMMELLNMRGMML